MRKLILTALLVIGGVSFMQAQSDEESRNKPAAEKVVVTQDTGVKALPVQDINASASTKAGDAEVQKRLAERKKRSQKIKTAKATDRKAKVDQKIKEKNKAKKAAEAKKKQAEKASKDLKDKMSKQDN